jgi:hypothetical protein
MLGERAEQRAPGASVATECGGSRLQGMEREPGGVARAAQHVPVGRLRHDEPDARLQPERTEER